MHLLDVADVNRSQSQVCRESFLPVYHMIGYLTKVPLHSRMVPVQLLLEMREGRGRERGDTAVEIITYNITYMKKFNLLEARSINDLPGEGLGVCSGRTESCTSTSATTYIIINKDTGTVKTSGLNIIF